MLNPGGGLVPERLFWSVKGWGLQREGKLSEGKRDSKAHRQNPALATTPISIQLVELSRCKPGKLNRTDAHKRGDTKIMRKAKN